jgi:cytochrome c oxidase assembly protein subunit 15
LIDKKYQRGEFTPAPRWLHGLAVLTVCIAVLALSSGAVVTTFQVGMADPIWPTYPWHLALISWQEPKPGFIIEHTHRLFDYLLGFFSILLAIGLWRAQPRRWLGWLGVAALGGVIMQGLLGGLRVLLHAPAGTELALIHGLSAQLVFALLVSLALFTSRSWQAPISFRPSAGAGRIWRLSVCTSLLIFVQIIFGAILRHTSSALGQRGHILVAFAVVAVVPLLVKMVFEKRDGEKPLAISAAFLAVLVAVQVMLGVEALFIRFGTPGLAELQLTTIPQAIIRTSHFVLGSLIFATAGAVSLWAHRGLAVPLSLPVATADRLEGAA